ncbi:MAG: UPF0147 family protein [Candidatus Marsarchaeota archaeon]|jgi:uncharacterized protein (UPF0147 family)|nr:UPF0147 family protein [Candidatus Marsarchaeota archaeon]
MADDKEIALRIEQITKQMDSVLSDTSVPKNVRSAVSDARKKLNENADRVMRVSAAIYHIDEVSNDINLPPHARTMLWNILNLLESIKD